ncbi:hypothetical protein KIW84_064829 [Lathyrus oleraceus]|uniref:Uncharacterized protein n=1 Tax=Pisum sativum TaxID=3888 RepID=A0A9D4WDP0_PEA|nr:hypothetical protein KIW84_064829 [Pisum sativum]
MSNSKNIFNTFTQQVTLKLDENNFHSRKQQIEGIIRTHKLRRFLVNPDVPLRYLVDEGRTNDTENHAFDMWEQHDLLLFTWLLTTIFGMRCTIDILESIDDSISHRDQLEAILDGLSEDYNALASIIQYRSTICPIIEVESVLLSNEATLDKAKQTILTGPLSVNVAQVLINSTQSLPHSNHDVIYASQFNHMPQLNENRGGFHGGGNFNRGRGGKFGELCTSTMACPAVALGHTSVPNQWMPSVLRGPPPGFGLSPSPRPQAYLIGTDTTRAGSPPSGSCIFLGPNLISWWSEKQTLVAKSNTEAEYKSLANSASKVLWIQSLLTQLSVPFTTPILFCVNLSIVALSHNPVLHARTKHMELDIFFLRENVLSKNLIVHHIPTFDQYADLLTKLLSPLRFLQLRNKLQVVDKSSLAHK